jgi:hypothetical protein
MIIRFGSLWKAASLAALAGTLAGCALLASPGAAPPSLSRSRRRPRARPHETPPPCGRSTSRRPARGRVSTGLAWRT